MITVLIIMIPVIALCVWAVATYKIEPHLKLTADDMRWVSSHPVTIPDHWKTVVYIQYKDNVLMLKYKDHSFTEYHYNNVTKDWRKKPSMKKVNNETALLIEDYFIKYPQLKRGKGGVNV